MEYPEEIKKFIGNKNIKANIFRLQTNDSVMCGYFCIGFIDFMLAGKKLTGYTNLFSPHDFKNNDDIIYKEFITILNEKDKYEKMKNNLRSKN